MINKIKKNIIFIKKIIDIDKLKIIYKNNINKIKKYDKNNFNKYITVKQKINYLNKIINIYNKILLNYKDVKLLKILSLKENISIIDNDLYKYYINIKKLIDELKYIIFNNEHDINSAIIQITSGAGGNDSSNWVKIISKMYELWSIKNNYKVSIINCTYINSNCIKNIVLEIQGKYAYGLLKFENGIHKLIRIYNNKRHTSFASVNVFPLIKNDKSIYINEKDIKYQTFRSSGSGGQNVDKVESGVRLIHKPTNISIVCTKTRSQNINKLYALKLLKSKLKLIKKTKTTKKNKIEWGYHNRNYIMHPYKMIKDLNTGYKTSNLDYILNGNIDDIINEYIKLSIIN
ncbi:MAG: PCRF domain-containing protein [Candidatus Shikimatogenerans bostrichidophilus]|nr:MAG: PCRF domain-containing protein [Candidatus Shikimatogenerans bostrichidophilus]